MQTKIPCFNHNSGGKGRSLQGIVLSCLFAALLSVAPVRAQNIDYQVIVSSIAHFEFPNCNEIGEEEYTAFVGVRGSNISGPLDGVTWSGCFTSDINGDSFTVYNQTLVTRSNSAADFVTFYMEAWENDSGGRCTFDSGDDCYLSGQDPLGGVSIRVGDPDTLRLVGPYGNNDHEWRPGIIWSYTQPAVPQNAAAQLQIVAGIRVTWTAAANATRYRVFHNTSPTFAGATSLGTTTQLQFDHGGFLIGLTNYYWVVGENDHKSSDPSAMVSVDARMDWGDAPSSYPVTSAQNGAAHLPLGPRMGTLVDVEDDGQPTPNAGILLGAVGDDVNGLDDEDGITVLTPFQWGNDTGELQLVVSGAPGRFDLWIDWNGDGTWSEEERQYAGWFPVGTHTLPINIRNGEARPGSTVTYMRARITDEASGPQSVGGFSLQGEVEDHSLVIAAPPFALTQIFSESNPNDLGFKTLNFVPDAGPEGYTACITPSPVFPTPPEGGNFLSFTQEPWMNEFVEVTPAGGPITFFGQSYSSFFVNRNGYITFGQGSPEYIPTLSGHYALPRISGLFLPYGSSTNKVSWKELPDRIVVTYDQVTQYVEPGNANAFQIEVFFNGEIRITLTELDDVAGIVGLSRGTETTPYGLTDLSALGCCFATGTLTPVFAVPGSPAISPPGSPNNIGDNFDLDTTGGAAVMTGQCGFGAFGEIYFNHDENYLYLGAFGADPAGPNAILLFLGVGSLADGKTNLASMSGQPNALGQLQNLSFASPMNVAILLGDEYGDGNFPEFLIQATDFGQGVYSLAGGPGFTPIADALLSQFDGEGGLAVTNINQDADQQVNRWEVAIPWSALNAPNGIADLGSLDVAGVIVGGTGGNDRYLSGNYLGAGASHTDLDINSNYGFGAVTLTPLPIGLRANRFVAPGGGHVSPFTTWATAATNIQDAIDAATLSDKVIVSNGVYDVGGRVVAGSSLTNRVVIDKPITVESVNGPEVTRIKGAWDPVTTNGNAAVRCVWMVDGATLVGFTLTNGATRATGEEATERAGGGINAVSTGAIVSNCVIAGNTAAVAAGGAWRATLHDTLLTGNRANFGGATHSSILYDCDVQGNVSGNQGGGTYIGEVHRTVIRDNYAAIEGGGAWGGTLNNCTLTGNSADVNGGGGAIFSTLNNCTLTGNSAAPQGGGVRSSTLNNCIVYFNNAPHEPNYSFGTNNYTCTTPLPGSGTGNITNAPAFVNAAGGDYRLLATSPGIDAGNNADAPSGPDLAGHPRVANGIVDMGAYEYDAFLADYDSDGDGQVDRDEAVAGTDVTDETSFFAISELETATPGELRFGTVLGRVYGVERSDALGAVPQVWVSVTNGIPGTGAAVELVDPDAVNVPHRSYRATVRLAP